MIRLAIYSYLLFISTYFCITLLFWCNIISDINLSMYVQKVRITKTLIFKFICSVQFSRSGISDSLWPHELQHARPLCPSPAPGVHSNSRPLNWWCHPTISSSVDPFSTCPQSFPSIRVFFNELALRMRCPKYWSFSFNISPSNEHSGLISFRMDWWISLESKGLSRLFSNTTVEKHQFFSTQLSL